MNWNHVKQISQSYYNKYSFQHTKCDLGKKKVAYSWQKLHDNTVVVELHQMNLCPVLAPATVHFTYILVDIIAELSVN